MAKIKTNTISMQDVSFIFNGDLRNFKLVVSNCFCSNCEKDSITSITNYTITLNNLFDIVLNGYCASCNNPITRYIETGDTAESALNAEAIWVTNKALKELKIKTRK